MNYRDVKKILIVPFAIPWRGVNGYEWNGETDIRTWAQGFPGATVTTPKDIDAPAGGGLNEFGRLDLITFHDNSGKTVDSTIYRDMVVREIDEASEDLAEVEDHDKGLLRVTISDFRDYYDDYGALLCDINTRLKNGKLAEESANPGTKKEWTAKEVFPFLFAMLPGTPIITSWSEFWGLNLRDPENIRGEGEPIKQHLQTLLDEFGLLPQRQPDGNYAVSRRASSTLKYGFATDSLGKQKKIKEKNYEQAAATNVVRPPAVMVLGKRRVRRITVKYVPVLEDQDGLIYRLEDIVRKYDYTMDKLKAQRFVGDEKSFEDVTRALGGVEHDRIKKLFRQAYTKYAPAFLFSGGTVGSGVKSIGLDLTSLGLGGLGAQQSASKKNIVGVSPDDAALVPLLPALPFAVYKSEASVQDLNVPSDKAKKKKGDLGPYFISQPIARGLQVDEGFYSDYATVSKEFKARLRAARSKGKGRRGLIAMYSARAKSILDSLLEAEFALEDTLPGVREIEIKLTELEKDEIKSLLGITLIPKTIDKRMSDQATETARLLKYYAVLAQELKEEGKEDEKKVKDWEDAFKIFDETYSQQGGFQLKMNLPYSILPSGSYTIDEDTGILDSSQPLCHMDKPFMFDSDVAKVGSDGNVWVTYGCEIKINNILGYSAFQFRANDSGDDVICVRACRSGPIKSKVIKTDGRIYEADLGTPINIGEFYEECRGKATQELLIPQTVQGMTYEWAGLRDVVLHGGAQSVQHTWDGDIGTTFLSVNAPNALMPLGPPSLADASKRASKNVQVIARRIAGWLR